MYNVNVKNTVRISSAFFSLRWLMFRKFGVGSQALALSSYGTNVGYYGCAFFGFVHVLAAFDLPNHVEFQLPRYRPRQSVRVSHSSPLSSAEILAEAISTLESRTLKALLTSFSGNTRELSSSVMSLRR